MFYTVFLYQSALSPIGKFHFIATDYIASAAFCKIGVYYGNPEVTSGGIALKFFASVRLEIRPTGKIKSVSTITA